MKSEIKVSIVVPIYNVEKYLKRCLDSIQNQTYHNIEVILVNDGSTDSCADICHQFQKKYSDIIYVEKQNGGLVSAWLTGLKYVTGQYICFIDSDDFISQDYIFTLVNALEQDVDMVSMNCIRYFDDGTQSIFKINSISPGTYKIDDIKERIISDFGATFRIIATCRWAKIIKTDLVLKYSQYVSEKISYGEDQQLTVGIMLGCNKIKVIDEYKYFYQYNQTSILNTYKRDLYKKISLLIETIRAIPEVTNISTYEKQLNTQFLMYCNECIKNEFYFGKLNRRYFTELCRQKQVKNALTNFYTEKMRFLDCKMLKFIDKEQYVKTKLLLLCYGIYCWIKKQPL